MVEATRNDVQRVRTEMEVGYRLIPMVDFSAGWRIAPDVFAAFVKKFAQDMGFPATGCPYSRQYGFTACALPYFDERGRDRRQGTPIPGRWLAINPGTAAGTLPGEKTVDPAFGLDAIWLKAP
ncbi:FHIPEP family type III secretion protein [Salmonella enterica subsp. enterica]|nr:FHIPEP family type III secretion protein [Salmonella enterica subsp. enterica]